MAQEGSLATGGKDRKIRGLNVKFVEIELRDEKVAVQSIKIEQEA